MTHTPGPWTAYTDDKAKVWLIMPMAIAVDDAADACLIEAAPDLLEIARRVVSHFDDTDSVLKIDAQDAIRKATGGA